MFDILFHLPHSVHEKYMTAKEKAVGYKYTGLTRLIN